MSFRSRRKGNAMDELLAKWLEDGPYTHLNNRLRDFVFFCWLIHPSLSRTFLRRVVYQRAQELMKGPVGQRWTRDRNVRRTIRMYGENDQRTAQWHAKRGEKITASELGYIFTGGETARSVMLRKLEPPAPQSGPPIPALIWGTRFEPIGKAIYEAETECTITDVSCVQHPIYPFLGASPDGIIFPTNGDRERWGRLVEFKCPISRVAKDQIPAGYIHQMQLQMECTGINECEYVEFRFKQVHYGEWSKFEGRKGIFAIFEDETVNYKPKDQEVVDWQVTLGEREHQKIYWTLGSIKRDFVPKDPNWMSSHIDELTNFWNEIVRHRANGTKPEPIPSSIPTLNL